MIRAVARAQLLAATALTLAVGAPAAHAQPLPAARLQGTFTMTGRVTVAHHVPGERVGQQVTRAWTFTPLCPTGPCNTVQLVRARITGTDTLTLRLRPGGIYAGRGSFYLPLGCARHRYPLGELVPFKISVRVTGKAVVNGTVIATSLAATYRNRTRNNLTPCVAVLGHDAASYAGTLTPPVAPATSRSPAGS